MNLFEIDTKNTFKRSYIITILIQFQLQVKEVLEWKREKIFGSLKQIKEMDGQE